MAEDSAVVEDIAVAENITAAEKKPQLPFTIFHSIPGAGNGDDGIITVTHPVAMSLSGDWSMALKEISFPRTRKVIVPEEALRFVVAAPKEYENEYDFFVNWFVERNYMEMGPEFPKNSIKGFHKACIMKCTYEEGNDWTVPGGEYTGEIYRELVNEVINKFNTYTGNGLYGYTRKIYFEWNSKLERLELFWDYGNNLWRKIYLYPFVGEVGNTYLGLPSPTSDSWKQIMEKSLEHHANILLKPGDVADRTDIILQCNLIGQNSNIRASKIQNDVDSRCLRIINQSSFKGLKHGEFVSISFKDDPVYIPVRKSLITSMNFRLVSTETLRPVSITGIVNLTLEFRPMNMSAKLQEIQEERDWIASRPHEFGMWSKIETRSIQSRKD